ncbi:calcium-binding protein 39 isoform X5 [Myotis daubentonii]|uniref:calcium-binding protein 39 isoform X6 n=1 Tax=Pipistrellus kuhlii TaxID=59472 RepID=UPI001E26F563|nr:calcium-binding protein 39 isoform X6 [Pipistrellus kuhlii]XP_059559469.1 calcium-binding protein 39 isoform X5 [Myotis daubentonii]
MPFPFGKSHKSPADIVKNLKESMAVLEKQDISDKKAEKATEEVSKNLVAMKEILYGTNEKEPQTEAVAQLAQELYNSGLLSTLVADLQLIDFEGKKDVAQIFNNILRRQIGTRTPTVEYICTQQNILFMLLKGYESPEIALNCGIMLRECIRHEPLAKIILWSEQFYDFFRYVEMSTFDIASDAFATFKFFSEYEKLLHSENYVTKRQSLKVFVANPNKTQPILDILLKNQTKLIEFLSKFQNDRTEDEQFNDEKTYLVKQIRDLKRPAQQEA